MLFLILIFFVRFGRLFLGFFKVVLLTQCYHCHNLRSPLASLPYFPWTDHPTIFIHLFLIFVDPLTLAIDHRPIVVKWQASLALSLKSLMRLYIYRVGIIAHEVCLFGSKKFLLCETAELEATSLPINGLLAILSALTVLDLDFIQAIN